MISELDNNTTRDISGHVKEVSFLNHRKFFGIIISILICTSLVGALTFQGNLVINESTNEPRTISVLINSNSLDNVLVEQYISSAFQRYNIPLYTNQMDSDVVLSINRNRINSYDDTFRLLLDGPFSSELGDTYSKLCIGQQMDIAFETRSIDQITVQDSLEMLGLKTSVLFELSCDWGARLAGATEDQLYFVNAYAKSVGMAFQLRDDILNIIADPEITGKPRASDIINGKKTPLAIATYHNARPKEQGFFADHLGKIENKDQLADMTNIISIYGLHSTDALMNNYIRTAKWAIEELSKFGLDKEVLDLLYIFAEYSIEREM